MSNSTAMSANEIATEWTLAEGAQSIFFAIVFPFTSLVLMSFPQMFDRWVAVTVVLLSAYAAFVTSDHFSPDDTLNEVYTRYILIGGSYMLSMAYKIDSKKKVQSHFQYKTERPNWNPWYKGYKLMWNIRGVGLSWENPYLWPGVKHTWDAPDSANFIAKSKKNGMAIRCCYILINFCLLVCLYEFVNTDYLLGASPSDHSPETESIIRRLVQTFFGHTLVTPVSLREFQVRAIFSLENAADNYLLFSLYADACAVLFITVGLDESWEWPPFFGQVMEAYTLRRWWSTFWHRSVYRSFGSHSELILKRFGVKRSSNVYRTLTAFNIFGLSAVMHSLVSWKYGNKCAWGRSMSYWFFQPAAFTLEGIVQACWSRFRERNLGKKGRLRMIDLFARIVGYVWVCTFLMWVDPKRHYPLRNCLL